MGGGGEADGARAYYCYASLSGTFVPAPTTAPLVIYQALSFDLGVQPAELDAPMQHFSPRKVTSSLMAA